MDNRPGNSSVAMQANISSEGMQNSRIAMVKMTLVELEGVSVLASRSPPPTHLPIRRGDG
jgi:hypothetical protein